MKSIDIKAFREANNLTQKELADYLGIDKGFISAIEHGKSKFPKAKLTMLLNNQHNWDVSMLTQSEGDYLTLMSGLRPRSEFMQPQIRSAVEQALDPTEKFLIGYLERKIENQDAIIRELYKKIGMLEAKLELVGKGEIASSAEDSSCADAI